MSLVPVHGGLAAPVSRFVQLAARKSMLAEAATMPSISVTRGDLATVYRIADGTLSPLTGFMDQAVYERVLTEQHIVNDGKKYAWTIPFSLPVTESEAAKLTVGAMAALRNPEGELVGVIRVSSKFAWDKAAYIQSVYRTTRTDHPGGAMIMDDPRVTLVGGEIQVLPYKPHPVYGHQVLSPNGTRAMIEDRGWEAALAFQTRNPLHRAHEYALVYGLEVLTRQGLYAGAVLNPLVGELKGDDVDAPTRMRCYNVLFEKELLGKGDADTALWEQVGYEIPEVFALVGLDIKMHYAGPAEAVMHAIYRQNHGYSHLVIGRKHADAPYFDGKPIWGDFDAQEIFQALQGELHIKPLNVGFAAYYDGMGRVDLMENHPDDKPFFISGSKVREILVSGERPDARILRPEVADILIAVYRENRA